MRDLIYPQVAPGLPENSHVHGMRLPARHVLIRTHSPVGLIDVAGMDPALPEELRTIYVERNSKHPRIWGWLLAVRYDDMQIDGILPGQMVIFKRYAEEEIDHDKPKRPLFLGHTLPISVIHISALEAVFQKPLRKLEV